jgi:Ca-activated chloride channel family protein
VTFLWPPLLLATGLVPLGILVARRIDERRRRRMVALGGLGWATRAADPGWNTRFRDRIQTVLVVAAFILFAVALARPQATVSLPRIEGTVVLTFDVSGSMAADDVTPSRMEVAKVAAKAIVDRRPPGVVVGVVAFSDAGLAIQIPTADDAMVLRAIDRLGPARGTSLGQGILASLGAIQQAESDTPPTYYSNRSPEPSAAPSPVAPGSHDAAAIVLFSDGENNERPDPLAAASAAADRGIRIQTVGIGTAAGTTLDLDGFRVQTQLDEGLLRQIAYVTDGTYQPGADADPGRVYDELAERPVLRDESIEVTALVAAVGLVLLIGAGVASLAASGRLP